MDLLGPGRHLLGMLRHEPLHARDERLEHGPQLRANLKIAGAADLLVPPDALGEIVRIELGPEDLGHRTRGTSIILEQLLEPVLRLRIANRIRRRL